MEPSDTENNFIDPMLLSTVRRRRWFWFSLILGYIPATAVVLNYASSMQQACVFFGVWFVLLCLATVLLALSKCPRCGNTFHMRNSSLSFFSKCRHCDFHLATS
jgi:hypothetical protein